ncbi:MAG: DotU family type IV/VI secretion system protein [Alphaproteobacteria bacterium]|nr:DotU family type IV/VI secretion system protein [Alphaproteobacteria bacterium]
MSHFKVPSHSFLVHNFREFFNLLLRQKEFALRANEKDPLKLEKQAGNDKVANIVNTIQRRLSVLFEEQAVESTIQVGEFATSSYQDALYAMIALADEIFLNISWIGQKEWEDNLLESRFFQTQIAGELIFDKIDDLIAHNDPMRSDLAMVYLYILGLGFMGKFRDKDEDQTKLEYYKKQLYIVVNRRPSDLYEPGREHLIQDCYEHVLDSTLGKGLPEIRMWLLTFAGIIGAYLFASTILWYKLVKGMDEYLSQILLQAHQMGIS